MVTSIFLAFMMKVSSTAVCGELSLGGLYIRNRHRHTHTHKAAHNTIKYHSNHSIYRDITGRMARCCAVILGDGISGNLVFHQAQEEAPTSIDGTIKGLKPVRFHPVCTFYIASGVHVNSLCGYSPADSPMLCHCCVCVC
jgi:hypothetical protein